VRGAAREAGPYRERRADYEQAVEAARRWIAEQGRYPQQQEWEHRAPGRPTTRTIKRRWGWEELMRAAAGAGARSPKLEMRRQHRLELLLTLCKAREELGRWPTAGEWEASTSKHLSRRSYVRTFGSWRRACLTAARLKL
jgi:HNH endonuclease